MRYRDDLVESRVTQARQVNLGENLLLDLTQHLAEEYTNDHGFLGLGCYKEVGELLKSHISGSKVQDDDYTSNKLGLLVILDFFCVQLG